MTYQKAKKSIENKNLTAISKKGENGSQKDVTTKMNMPLMCVNYFV